jgi:hypothetical protein
MGLEPDVVIDSFWEATDPRGMAMPSFELKVGTVRWINGHVSPIWFSPQAKLLEPKLSIAEPVT